ncbi:hypothetical protein LXL04_032222 [Taraxacum kok-saghyz]
MIETSHVKGLYTETDDMLMCAIGNNRNNILLIICTCKCKDRYYEPESHLIDHDSPGSMLAPCMCLHMLEYTLSAQGLFWRDINIETPHILTWYQSRGSAPLAQDIPINTHRVTSSEGDLNQNNRYSSVAITGVLTVHTWYKAWGPNNESMLINKRKSRGRVVGADVPCLDDLSLKI